ncbi:hypothetical protein HOF40_03275 [Candidatus Parcubacteria bacterium]|jgi:hypothetical protein|nr:hypothetical protein [Candidatus Parcubacteria bacterium]MBT3949083.1 hypothetical protein [Candidatus Parcubacteria bacterium]
MSDLTKQKQWATQMNKARHAQTKKRLPFSKLELNKIEQQIKKSERDFKKLIRSKNIQEIRTTLDYIISLHADKTALCIKRDAELLNTDNLELVSRSHTETYIENCQDLIRSIEK